MSHLGSTVCNISTDELAHRYKTTTPIKVFTVELKYLSEEEIQKLKNITKLDVKSALEHETQLVITNELRLSYIVRTASKMEKNSLILFNRREYGKKLYTEFLNDQTKEVFYIDGFTEDKKRTAIVASMEEGNNKILVASYGTFSTGINLKNLHFIYLTESYKSEILVRQSIGRGVRLHDDKKFICIIDIVDDFRMKGYTNFKYLHSLERKNIYKEQKFQHFTQMVDLLSAVKTDVI